MQRYRVNYRLLATLVIAVVVAAPSAYGLWKFQVSRNASRLLEQADAAEAKGDYEGAFDSLSQYVKLRRDENEARLRLGHAAIKLSEQENLDIKRTSQAYFALVEAVQRTKDRELQRDLVDLHMKYGYIDRALELINELIAAGGADHELLALKAQCLFATQNTGEAAKWSYQVIGYDPQKDAFDIDKALAPDQPLVYARLASYLVSSRQQNLGGRVIDQMIVANPESRDAYVYQYQILSMLDRGDDARLALEKAFELDPKDASVLQYKGMEAIEDYRAALEEAGLPENADNAEQMKKDAEAHLSAAAGFFEEGLELYPDSIGFYEQVARIYIFRQSFDEALKIIEKGLAKYPLETLNAVGLPVALELESQKVDILFSRKDLEGVRKEVRSLRELKSQRVDALADYYEARIELFNQNWLEAARRLADAKIRLIGNANLQALASAHQAICHTQLGQWDLAKQAYQWALDKNPELTIARAGLDDVYNRLGQMSTEGTPLQFDEVISAELSKPAAEQNWPRVEEAIEEYVRKQGRDRGASDAWVESRRELLRAQMYVSRALEMTDAAQQNDLFLKARDAVRRAYSLQSDDVTVQLAAPRVIMLEPGKGPSEALKLLDKIIAANKKKGTEETLPYRLLRIELLFALRDEQLPNQLHAVTEGMDTWPKEQQAEVWAAVSARFEMIGQLSDAELCMKEAAKLAPTLLPYRVALFELARRQANDESMREAQKGVLELIKDPLAPDYVLTEVKRLMVNYGGGAITAEQMQEGRRMLEDAIRRRPTWAELHLLSGQLYIVLERDAQRALQAIDAALENSPGNLNALNLRIRMLTDAGRYTEARETMKRIPEPEWSRILDRVAAVVLRGNGESEKAYAEAKKLVDASPNDAGLLVWFGEIAAKANQLEPAEAAYKKAIDLNPTNPELWSMLLNFYMSQKRAAEVESTLRDSQLALDDEYLTLITAEQHRLFGRFPQAESIFLSAYADQLTEPGVSQRMGDFYLTWAQQDPAQRGKAAPFINTVLRAGNTGKLQLSDSMVAWARRQAALVFSLSGDYQESLKAERLLSSVAGTDATTLDDRAMLIDILNRRGDPASRMRMVDLLKTLQKSRPLTPEQELLLGKGLFDVADWQECESFMQDAISRHPDNVSLRVGLIEMLIQRKDASGAERWMSRLNGLEGSAGAIPQLRIRIADARGNKDEVRKLLTAMTPNLRAGLSAQQLQIVRAVALLADSVGDHEYALQLMTELARRAPGNEFDLARFTVMYGDIDAGLAMLQQFFPANMDATIGLAIDMLRERRAEATEKLDAAVSAMVRQARRNDPEAASRMLQEAQVLELQEANSEAIAAYNVLLKRDDVPRLIRATVLNNLAFMLAITKQDLDRALESANEAMEIIGPISDILDTRGLVYLHRGEYPQAIEDLKLAVKMSATANKYFHLAEAQLGAGDKAGALESWAQAETLGLGPTAVPKVELEDLDRTTKQIEALRTQTADL